jgi:hypothetical protein
MNIDTHMIITFLFIIVSCLFLSIETTEHFSICTNPNNRYYPISESGWKHWWRTNQSIANINSIGEEPLDKNIPPLTYDGI